MKRKESKMPSQQLTLVIVRQFVVGKGPSECYLLGVNALPFTPVPGIYLKDAEHFEKIHQVTWLREFGYFCCDFPMVTRTMETAQEWSEEQLSPKGWQVVAEVKVVEDMQQELLKKAMTQLQTALRDAQGRPIMPQGHC
jgi:hypothetical protein